MRQITTEVLTEVSKRAGIKPRVLFWVSARNRDTNAVETMGFWKGDDHQEFVVDGVNRLYYGAGNILDVDDLTFEAALNIRMWNVTFSGLTPEFAQAVRGYDVKGAPILAHLAMFSTDTNNLISPPFKVFDGWINKFPIKTPAIGGTTSAKMECVSNTRLLTKRVPEKRSQESQNKRMPGDNYMRNVGATGTIQTPWGSK